MQIFEKRLKEIRKERNLTQEDVGKAICVSKQEVCLYEKGKRVPPIDVLMKLSNFLEVDFIWLIGMEKKVSYEKNKVYNLSEEDIRIIKTLKESHNLYNRLLNDTERTIIDLNNKIGK